MKTISLKTFCMTLLGGLAWLAASFAYASSGSDERPALWLNLGGVSWHFEDRDRFNQKHPTIGLEYRLNHEWSLMAGRYKNSVHEKTNYVGAAYTPWSWRHLRFGVAFGVADGYPAMNQGRWFGLLTPVVMYENGRFGANLLIIPTISESVTGAIAIQFKFRLAQF